MKNKNTRDWLETYKINPKKDNTIYKNYQNPSMTKWETQFAGLSPAQKQRYDNFLNTIPDELKGLSAMEMHKTLQGFSEKQNTLSQEKAKYDNEILRLKREENQRQEQKRAEQEANRIAIARNKYRNELLRRREGFKSEVGKYYQPRDSKGNLTPYGRNPQWYQDQELALFDSGRLFDANQIGNTSDVHNIRGRTIAKFYYDYIAPESFSQVSWPQSQFPQGSSYYVGLSPKYSKNSAGGWQIDK